MSASIRRSARVVGAFVAGRGPCRTCWS